MRIWALDCSIKLLCVKYLVNPKSTITKKNKNITSAPFFFMGLLLYIIFSILHPTKASIVFLFKCTIIIWVYFYPNISSCFL